MKIAHLSDLHISLTHKQENLRKSAVLLEHALNHGADHVVITGDISHNAQPADFVAFRELLRQFDLLDSEKVSLVIGNHDIYGGVHLATDILNFPKRCKMTNYQQKLNIFCSNFKVTFESSIRKSSRQYFPFIKHFNDTVLIGLNSNALYSLFRNPLCSNGEINSEDFDFISDQLLPVRNSGKKIIVLIHHQLFNTYSSGTSRLWRFIEKRTMKLHGKKKLLAFIQSIGAELVLHGHTHINRVQHRDGIAFVNSGGSVEPDSGNLIQYHMLEREGTAWKITAKFPKMPAKVYEFPPPVWPNRVSIAT